MGFSAAEDVVPLLKKFGYSDAFKLAFATESGESREVIGGIERFIHSRP